MGIGILDLAIFVAATFLAAFVTGLSGFAFGLIAAGIWLHIISPVETAALIIAFGLLAQAASVWKIRHALDWPRLWPFLAGAAVGVPAGVAILEWVNPQHLREGVGIVLVLYSLYSLARPNLSLPATNSFLNVSVGFLNGVLGGATGLAGIIVAVWCSLLPWSKDEQRGIFQPVAIAVFLMSAGWLGANGAVSQEIAWLFVIGLPALAAGLWTGLQLYGWLDEEMFRKLILVLLLVSGISLFVQ